MKDNAALNSDKELLKSWEDKATRSAPRPQVLDQGGADGQPNTWLASVAQNVQKNSSNLQKELLHKQLLTYYSEWCSVPKPASSGLAFADLTLIFNPDGTITFKAHSPENNIYMSVPHPWKDPVLEDATAVVKLFLRQTFWRNGPALKCVLAALLLALMGYNVDRCFWTIGPGGVGQSLLTYLINGLLGNLHAYLDTNVFHSDDELRKQAELLLGFSGVAMSCTVGFVTSKFELNFALAAALCFFWNLLTLKYLCCFGSQ